MIVLGVPVVDMHSYTYEFLRHVDKSVNNKNLVHVVIVDNDSSLKYEIEELKKHYDNVSLIRNNKNLGYFYPLLQIQDRHPLVKHIGLCHNDIFIYEKNWEKKLIDCFKKDEKLFLIGLAGTTAIDKSGGYASSMKTNFLGLKGQSQYFLGEPLRGFSPVLAVDSLFMLFRKEAIELLDIDESISLYHWYDRIWSMRLIEKGCHVGVYGASIDHKSGVTAFGAKYKENAIKWCEDNNLNYRPDADETIYKYLQKKYVEEFKHIIPAKIDKNWKIKKT